VKLTICCYSHLLSEGLKTLLEGESSLKVSALEKDRNLREVAGLQPDLIIADLDTFFDHSEELLNKGHPKVLVIYNTARLPSVNGQLSEFISKGLVGILPPETDAILLKRAIKAVSQGELWINHRSMREMLLGGQQKVGLTRQEGQIVFHICRGYRNKEIAQRLNITEQTVKSHCNRIYKKFNVSDRLQLALLLMHDKSITKAEHKLEAGVSLRAE
jgi:DNA-binding NarL/FixJ family response regulator